MYELIQIPDTNCYYIQSPAKIGLVKLDDSRVCLIDSGSDKDAGRKVRQHLDANGWQLSAIYNTHSNADHIGGKQISAGPDRLPDLRARHRVRLHPAPHPGAFLPVRRLSLQGSVPQISPGPGK